jgi:predicted RNase H-like nuclease (RuvC/YqgF family)
VKRNTQAIVQLAAEKSRLARLRVLAAIAAMESHGAPINFNTISRSARVSKTFLYDPKHSDLAEQIRAFRQTNAQSVPNEPKNSNKSDTAKDAQIVRFKEHIKSLEDKVRALQEENELLYGKLSERSCA